MDSGGDDAGLALMYDESEEACLVALKSGDGYAAGRYAKGWIGQAGGAHTISPWLVSVVAGLQQGKPKIAVHAADLALRHWIENPAMRSVLLYVRGEVIRRSLRDPKTAQVDLDAAEANSPTWLATDLVNARAACAIEAKESRKRKPSVDQAPAYEGSGSTRVGPTLASRQDQAGKPPRVWEAVCFALHAR